MARPNSTFAPQQIEVDLPQLRRKFRGSKLMEYHVIHAKKRPFLEDIEGWYVQAYSNGKLGEIVSHLYATWPQAKAEADRLNQANRAKQTG